MGRWGWVGVRMWCWRAFAFDGLCMDRKKPRTLTDRYLQAVEKARSRRSQMSRMDVVVVDELLERAAPLVAGKKGAEARLLLACVEQVLWRVGK